MIYVTRPGDVLDYVLWKHYGSSDMIVQVYEANPGLAEHPVSLPGGLRIELPAAPSRPAKKTLRVWD